MPAAAGSVGTVAQPSTNGATANASLAGSSLKAEAPLPASGGAAAAVSTHEESPATGAPSGITATAADDAAAVFQIRECRGDMNGECDPKPFVNGGRGSGSGSAGAASNSGSGGSGGGGASAGSSSGSSSGGGASGDGGGHGGGNGH